MRNIQFDALGYLTPGFIAAAMIGAGFFYRPADRSERIDLSMICTGIFIIFTANMSFFNYLMLPLKNGLFVVYLARVAARAASGGLTCYLKQNSVHKGFFHITLLLAGDVVESKKMRPSQLIQNKLPFNRAESFVFSVTFIAFAIDLILIFQKQVQLDFVGYSFTLLIAAGIIGIGLFYRISGRSEAIAAALICTSAFILMTAAVSLFNYLLLPLKFGPYDHFLIEIDALFGYHWPSVMAFAAEHPLLTDILGMAYMTSMFQLALLVVILGLRGHVYDMHTLLVSITITGILSVCFWGIFPTLGPTAVYELPEEIWASVNPLVNAEYGTYLNELIATGPGYLTPAEVRGLIAFPSFHAVMAFTAMYAARNVKYLAPALFALNLLILPSIFMHGGHHLVDLPAGFVMFILGTYLAKIILGAAPVPVRSEKQVLSPA